VESQRLLEKAKGCAVRMKAAAEASGDAFKAGQAQQRIERDIDPLAKEIQRALGEMSAGVGVGHDAGGGGGGGGSAGQRDELFYQPPDLEGGGGGESQQQMMDSLIQSSDELLRESRSVLAETEEIGTSTLRHMGQQREQLQNANTQLEAVQAAAAQAALILRGMSRKALKSKLFLYALISVLGGANLYVLYLIVRKHFAGGEGGDGEGNFVRLN